MFRSIILNRVAWQKEALSQFIYEDLSIKEANSQYIAQFAHVRLAELIDVILTIG